MAGAGDWRGILGLEVRSNVATADNKARTASTMTVAGRSTSTVTRCVDRDGHEINAFHMILSLLCCRQGPKDDDWSPQLDSKR